MTPPGSDPTELRRKKPGQRFQDRYWRHHQAQGRRPMVVRVLLIAAAVFVAAVGLLLLVLPGPGLLLLAVAGALVASESLAIARTMDWIEVRARAVMGWLWRRLGRRGPREST